MIAGTLSYGAGTVGGVSRREYAFQAGTRASKELTTTRIEKDEVGLFASLAQNQQGQFAEMIITPH